MPKVDRVMREIIDMPITRGDRADDLEVARQCKRKLVRQISVFNNSVSQLIGVYDQKYGKLTQGSDARAFREFLLNAPHLFVELGEKFGGLAHIESFWRFRFPKKRNTPMRADEVLPIFADFMLSVGLTTEGIDVAA